LGADYTWSFTTSDPSSRRQLTDQADRYWWLVYNQSFQQVSVEILRAQGLNEFSAKDISQVMLQI